ncbi:biotin--[acetyl-CoA-carboxylase] ligase [Candidatus Woesearchaeota archaeon]|nr:biotin--[acetyl-CoA-carboxylase] ligase [Candidatus Woesearchaeota archaeon]
MKYTFYPFKSLTSTQDKAKEFSKKASSSIVVIADTQTEGRGRFKRKWHSAKGGIWMSILLIPSNIEKLQYLTFIAAISVVRSIKKTTKLKTNIKWPNDVHYKGKKLCGILTEGIFGRENYVVVGIGLNVNQTEFSDDVKDTATSLKIVKKRTINIEKIKKTLISEFFILYEKYYNKNKLKDISKIWRKHCDTLGKNVTIITKTKIFTGKAIGIDENCNLLLKQKNNEITRIVEGDVNVRY